MNEINFPLWVGPPTKCTTRSYSKVLVKGSSPMTRHGAVHVIITFTPKGIRTQGFDHIQ